MTVSLHDRLVLENRLKAAKSELSEHCRQALTGDRAAGERAAAVHAEVSQIRDQLKRLDGLQLSNEWAEMARIRAEERG